MEVFQYEFMQRAIIAGFFISLVCPIVGVFLVIRRLSLIGDALSHVCLTGVAVGLFTGINPTLGSIIAAILGSLSIEVLRKKFIKYAELSLAIIMSAGMGVAIILLSIYRGNSAELMSFLFGSIIAITKQDLLTIIIMSCVVLGTVFLLYNKLLYIAFDEEAAQLTGMPVNLINFIFISMVGITVAVSLRIIGVLMVSAMITIPAAISLQIAKSFKQALVISVSTAIISVISGLISSYYLSLAPGGIIIIIAISFLCLVLLLKSTKYIFIKKGINKEYSLK